MELPLVVGVDGSESSLLAVDWAVAEAVRHGVPLRLVHASLWERYEGTMPPFSPGRGRPDRPWASRSSPPRPSAPGWATRT